MVGLVLIAYQLYQVDCSNRLGAMTTVYAEQDELSRFLTADENISLRKHFYRDDETVDLAVHQAKLIKDLEQMDETQLARLMMIAEVFANSSECVYQMRWSLPRNDWNAWWASFQDTYDESPVLQRFHNRRRTWYVLGPYLSMKDPIARDKALRRDFW